MQVPSTSICVSAIIGVTNNPGFMVLGTPFLRAYMSVFSVPDLSDLSSATVGFAPANGVSAAAPVSEGPAVSAG